MKLEQFHYLLEINRLHSISAAARSLHMGQTTLSAIVKSIEDELGFPIFQRNPSGVVTTPIGARFMTLAWEIDVKYEELIAVKRQTIGGAPAVTIQINPSIAYCVALPLTTLFSQYELQGNLVFCDGTSQKVEANLINNSGNIGLCILAEEDIQRILTMQKIHVEKLMSSYPCLLTPEDHRLAAKKSVDLRELAGERIICAVQSKADISEAVPIPYSAQLIRFTSYDILMQAVIQRQAIGIIPNLFKLCQPVIDKEKLCVIPISNTGDDDQVHLCLLTRKDRELRNQETVFIECVHSYFHSLLDTLEEQTDQ